MQFKELWICGHIWISKYDKVWFLVLLSPIIDASVWNIILTFQVQIPDALY